MTSLNHSASPDACRGFSLLEVLVTIVILAFGLLGLAALQGRAHNAELESYQRGQAIILMQDMISRLSNNAANAASYVTNSPRGTGTNDGACAGTRAEVDLCEWSKALKGASETKTAGGTTTNQGAMIDGRGCVQTTETANVYLVSVVWQGLTPTRTPTTTCGENLYDSESTRRAVTTFVQIPTLVP